MNSTVKAGADDGSYMRPPLNIGAGAERPITGNAVFDGTFDKKQAVAHKDGKSARIKVLVVDDEHLIANTLSIILNISGFEARAVYSGEAALQAFGTFEPDVLISDVVMTGISGIEAAIALRTQRPHCTILLFSGQAATADLLQRAREQGHHFEIIAKPVHPSDLLAKLRAGSAALNAAHAS